MSSPRLAVWHDPDLAGPRQLDARLCSDHAPGPRTSSASSFVFIPGAYEANSSRRKYDCAEPAATIKLS